ncbi:uncharacterized protein LOC142587853 [Dermacentor variabilis]|uniref:uncharacterized protein LOC142587853 n=1 Tax=Dermacentor variabilis TaxID=34621 RepID=UPI003F5B7396
MTSRPFPSFHILVQLVVLTSIWLSHVLETKVYSPEESLHGFVSTWHESTGIIEPRMALSAFQSYRRRHYGTPGVLASDACPAEGRDACADGVRCIWTVTRTMCLCTCESNGVKAGSG